MMKKFEDVDVIDALRKIMLHNTMHYQTDFEYDVRMLTEAVQSRTANRSFLWMSRDCGTWCFPARDVYIGNTPEHHTWRYYGYLDNVKAFWIDLDKIESGIVRGNIAELDYQKNVEDIGHNSHRADSVEIVFCNPYQVRTFDIVDYNETRQSIQARYGLEDRIAYKVPNENALNHMLEMTKDSCFKKAQPASVDDYVRDMVRDYFHSRGYTADDMAFTIPRDIYAAIRQGVPVYALRPENVQEQIMSIEDANRLHMKETLFGIRHEDKKLLDYLVERPSMKNELFTREEFKELFSISLQAGKADTLDESDRKVLDGIIYKLDKIVFPVNSEEHDIQQSLEYDSAQEIDHEI